MNKLIFFLLPLSFILGNLVKFSLYSQDIRFSLLDISIILLNIIAIVDKRGHIKQIIIQQPLYLKSIFVFSLFGLLSLLINIPRWGMPAGITGLLYLFRWLNYSLVLIPISLYLSTIQTRKLLLVLGVLSVILGLTQYVLMPDVRFLAIDNWDPHYYRVIGTFLDPGFTGLIFVFTLISLTIRPLKGSFSNFIVWSLTYLALSLTYSRSSYLAFIVAMAGISLYFRSWRFFITASVLLMLTLLILPKSSGGEGVKLSRTSSIQARIINWQHSLQIWKDNPLIGVGFNTYRYAQRQYGFLAKSNWLSNHAGAGADSSLLFVLATTGVVGIAAYLYYLRSIFILSAANPELKSVFLAVLVHSLFLNSLFYPAVLVWLSLLIRGSNLHSKPIQSYSPPGQKR